MRTGCFPARVIDRCSAARLDRSIFRPLMKGPQSLTRTLTERPFARLVTLTSEPSGTALEAAVSSRARNRSPLAVLRPSTPGPYHDATPVIDCVGAGTGASWGAGEARPGSVAGVTGASRVCAHAVKQPPAATINKSRTSLRCGLRGGTPQVAPDLALSGLTMRFVSEKATYPFHRECVLRSQQGMCLSEALRD